MVDHDGLGERQLWGAGSGAECIGEEESGAEGGGMEAIGVGDVVGSPPCDRARGKCLVGNGGVGAV